MTEPNLNDIKLIDGGEAKVKMIMALMDYVEHHAKDWKEMK